MPVLSKRIVPDCFYLLIFYSEKVSTDVCRLPNAVNVNLNLTIRFSYKHGNFSCVCLLVKMASKTVTRSMDNRLLSYISILLR